MTNELLKILIILGGGSIALFLVMARWIKRLRGSFKPFQKATIWYVLIALLLFSLIACLAYFGALSSAPTVFFIVFQAYFLLLGAWHVYAMHRNLRWTGDEKSFWQELLFTFIVCAFGCIGFLFLFRIFNKDGLQNIMAASALFFLVPLLVYQTFKKATQIPPKILKQWFYPVHEEIEEPQESKLKNLLVISFEFKKQTGAEHYTNFRAKAPKDMEVGELFYYFINDYNERHTNSKIQFIDKKGEPYGWIFYKKPRWYSIFTRYIDAEKTTFINNIHENDIIICNRLFN